MSKPRLALVVPGLDLGGGVPSVARFLHRVAHDSGVFDTDVIGLAMSSRDGASVRLLSPRTWIRGAVAVERSWDRGRYLHIGAVAAELEFQRYRPSAPLRRALANADLIQMVCGSPAWANTVRNAGVPVSLQVATRAKVERRRRDHLARGPSGWWRRTMTGLTDRFDDRGFSRVDAVQVENAWMLEYARRMVVGRNVDVRLAPPGLDTDQFSPGSDRFPRNDPYILCVGRLGDPRKNVDMLLEAYATLPGSLQRRTTLILAGSAPPDSLWRRASALGLEQRVHLVEHPTLSNLIELYRGAAVFALPSDEEGLGVVILEAMACGLPVVATRCGGAETVIDDGSDGLLVERDDHEAMGEHLARLLCDPALAMRLGRAARETIEARFTQRVAGQAFLDVWKRLLDHSRGR